MLKAAIHRNLDALDDGTMMLKPSLPSIDNFYADLIDHPKVLKVVALSRYSRDESNEIGLPERQDREPPWHSPRV